MLGNQRIQVFEPGAVEADGRGGFTAPKKRGHWRWARQERASGAQREQAEVVLERDRATLLLFDDALMQRAGQGWAVRWRRRWWTVTAVLPYTERLGVVPRPRVRLELQRQGG